MALALKLRTVCRAAICEFIIASAQRNVNPQKKRKKIKIFVEYNDFGKKRGKMKIGY